MWISQPHLQGLLVLLVASVVYHKDFLLASYGDGNSALVQGLALFADEARLGRLQAIVTQAIPQAGTMPATAGMGPGGGRHEIHLRP
jgi:hypothetical protein